jgi:hypothetical protein
VSSRSPERFCVSAAKKSLAHLSPPGRSRRPIEPKPDLGRSVRVRP